MRESALPSAIKQQRVRFAGSVSPRSRSIARVHLRRWCDHASDRSQVCRLQANDAIYWKCFRGHVLTPSKSKRSAFHKSVLDLRIFFHHVRSKRLSPLHTGSSVLCFPGLVLLYPTPNLFVFLDSSSQGLLEMIDLLLFGLLRMSRFRQVILHFL